MAKFIAWFLVFVGGFFFLDGVLCIPVVLAADGMTLLQRIPITLFCVAMALGGFFLCGKGIKRLNAISPPTVSEETAECAETPSETLACKEELPVPVRFVGTEIHIDSVAVMEQRAKDPAVLQHEFLGILPLSEKEPVIKLYEDGVLTREYCLQTEGDEDFTGKYFFISVRVGLLGNPPTLVAQIDGFISDTPEERTMTLNDIGYRMEGHFLHWGPFSNRHYENIRGQDLPAKGLKYVGYTTPTNVRLIGICPECGKSFGFHGYAFYMMQQEVAYSDDGLDCCAIGGPIEDKNSWTYEVDGKTFRYYNSFCCPYCGEPYIDYQKYPQNKAFGVSGCVHLGREAYSVP